MSEHELARQPEALEIPLADGLTLQGLIWPGEALPVLFVHGLDEEDDLDRWGSLPEIVHRAGHAVLAIDLPGHGLSDGEATEDEARQAIARCYRHISESFGSRFAVVVEGSAAGLLPPEPLAALVLFSPRDVHGAVAAHPKLVFAGVTDPQARDAADRYLRASRGWTLISSYATPAQGTALLQTPHAAKITAQLLSFLRDYR